MPINRLFWKLILPLLTIFLVLTPCFAIAGDGLEMVLNLMRYSIPTALILFCIVGMIFVLLYFRKRTIKFRIGGLIISALQVITALLYLINPDNDFPFIGAILLLTGIIVFCILSFLPLKNKISKGFN